MFLYLFAPTFKLTFSSLASSLITDYELSQIWIKTKKVLLLYYANDISASSFSSVRSKKNKCSTESSTVIIHRKQPAKERGSQ